MSTETTKRPTAAEHMAAIIRERINRGSYAPGQLLPGRRQLAVEHAVSPRTVDLAVSQLVRQGLVRVEQARGTFVREDIPGSVRLHRDNAAHNDGYAGRVEVAQVLGMIAALAPNPDPMDSGFYWPRSVISALEQSFLRSGHATILCNIDEGGDRPFRPLKSALDELISRGATVIVVIDLFGMFESDEIAGFVDSSLARDIPTVFVASRTVHGPIPFVTANLSYAGYLAAEHLLQQGAEELLFATPLAGGWVEERIAFAREAVAHLKMPEDTLRVVRADPALQVSDAGPTDAAMAARRLALDMIDRGMLREGIIAANDLTAHEIINAAKEAGLMAGQDFLIVGVDDAPDSVTLGLTSIRLPLEEIGREADLLLKRVVEHQFTGVQVSLRPQLITRSSSCRTAGSSLATSRQGTGET